MKNRNERIGEVGVRREKCFCLNHFDIKTAVTERKRWPTDF